MKIASQMFDQVKLDREGKITLADFGLKSRGRTSPP